MGVMLRSGEYGEYWGNDFKSSNFLKEDKMKINAKYIMKALGNKGFTLNAICGMLGNMEVESTINPGCWQNHAVGVGPAYGLVQWDKFTKYTNWCHGDPSTMDNNISRIVYEIENNLQWSTKDSPYKMSFKQFAKSKDTAYNLAMVFIRNYERPKYPNQPDRGVKAEKWYKYLSYQIPEDKPTPTPPIPLIRVQNTRKWACYKNFRVNINIRGD